MRHIALSAIVLVLVLALGCEEKDKYTLRFSHPTHVTELGMECSDCHGDVTKGEAAMPTHDNCVACHEDAINAKEITKETCGTCHVEKDLETIGEAAKPEKVTTGVFRHSAALEGRCRTCHGGLFKEGATEIRAYTRADVVKMREIGHAMNLDCSACHEYLNRDWMPKNHIEGWERRHGILAQEPDAVCSVCHREVTCRECHQSHEPASHNNLWRLRTHGIEATWARERCMVCHQDDFCRACHSETQPRSHNALWVGGRRPRHCTVCHEPGQNCAVCHEKDAPAIHTVVWPPFHLRVENVQDCFQSSVCHAQGVIPNP